MATPHQIANDLDAQARKYTRTGQDDLVRSLRRAAECIRELVRENAALATGCVVAEIRFSDDRT